MLDSDLLRVMRKTGKLYELTLASCGLTVVAAVLVVMWNENSSPFHLWFDIAPQGLGMASVITTTLIVSVKLLSATPRVFSRVLLCTAGHDCERRQRGSGSRYRQYVLST